MSLLKKIKVQIKNIRKKYEEKIDFINYRKEIKRKGKLNVGSGNIEFDKSWFSCDKDLLNITERSSWNKLLGKIRLENIFAEHVWEHLSLKEAELANKNCYIYLKNNGRLRIAVPDGFHPSTEYIDYVKPGGYGAGADDHKILYNYKTIGKTLKDAGFKIELLEYWDEIGVFHYKNWSNSNGKVFRSKNFDKRNSGGELNYTSLIIDAVK